MVSVLFGAGASRDFFKPTLTTQYLTEAVKDPNNWNRVIKHYRAIKVIIVDYYNKPITMIDEYRDSENFILKIYNVFGPEWRVNINSNGQKVAWDVNEIATLNSSGFGKIFSQVYFYKKGYTEFLKDWINERITI